MFAISPGEWTCSAAHVTGQAADLASGHLSSDDQIAVAQDGWQGLSALALNARMDQWLQRSTALLTQVGEHAFALQEAAVQHAAAEAERGKALAQLGIAADGVASSTRQ